MKNLIRVTSYMTFEQWTKFNQVRVSTYTQKSNVLGLFMNLPEDELKELIRRCHELCPEAKDLEAEEQELGSRMSPVGAIDWLSLLPTLAKLLATVAQWSTESSKETLGLRLQDLWKLLELGDYNPRKAAPLTQILVDLGWEMCRVPKYTGAGSTVRVWVPRDRAAKARLAPEAEIQEVQRILAQDIDRIEQSTKY